MYLLGSLLYVLINFVPYSYSFQSTQQIISEHGGNHNYHHLCDGISVPREVSVGETFLVNVNERKFNLGKGTEIIINGIPVNPQYRQLEGPPGSRYISVLARHNGKVKYKRREIVVVERNPDDLPYPLIYSSEGRYTPRTIAFRVGNSNDTKLANAIYQWDFGDGEYGQTEGTGIIEHDFSSSLRRDDLTTQFNISVVATLPDNSRVNATKTIALHNLYAHNKRRGILTPRTQITHLSSSSRSRSTVSFWSVNITNVEDEPIHVDERRLQLLDSTVDSFDPIGRPVGIDLLVNPHETAGIIVAIRDGIFRGNVFGFGVHLNGTGVKSGLPIVASAYKKVGNPYNLLRPVKLASINRALNNMNKDALISSKLSHQDIQHILEDVKVLVPSFSPIAANISRDTMPETNQGHSAGLSTSGRSFLGIDPSVIPHLVGGGLRPSIQGQNATPTTEPNNQASAFDTSPEVGQECDPDNVPDDLTDGFSCQYTGTSQWKFAPGMLLNAHKGDLILSPGGGPGPIGQLLQHVHPAQFYSHQGIMTQNFIEIRHSTMSEEWLEDHPIGLKGSSGFSADAMRYGWPGTITQSIDHSFYGEPLTAPDNHRSYLVSALSYYPNRGDYNTLISPIVFKPPPQLETSELRQKLHTISDVAQSINGHYRLYAYTRPELALESGGTAPAEAGWAAGTFPTVCSSFVWLACQLAGVQLESANRFTTADDLESADIRYGAQVKEDTRDGLYLYTADERSSVATWLHGYIEDMVIAKSSLSSIIGAPYRIANLFVNTFAFDLVDGISQYLDLTQLVGNANAVSPDNTLWWDSPSLDNRNGFQSVYGHAEDLFYTPGEYTLVKIYQWAFSPSKGSVCGTVHANGGSVQGADVSMTGQQDIIVGADGAFCFTVPVGTYTVSAGLNMAGYWYSATQPVTIVKDTTQNIVLDLQPPPEIHRQITVTVQMDVTSVGIEACGTCTEHKNLVPQSVALAPWHEDASLTFEGDYSEPYVNGRLLLSIHLNADLSVTVSYTAQLRDGADVDNSLAGSLNVPKDETIQWTGLQLTHKWWSGAEGVAMDWTIENAVGHA